MAKKSAPFSGDAFEALGNLAGQQESAASSENAFEALAKLSSGSSTESPSAATASQVSADRAAQRKVIQRNSRKTTAKGGQSAAPMTVLRTIGSLGDTDMEYQKGGAEDHITHMRNQLNAVQSAADALHGAAGAGTRYHGDFHTITSLLADGAYHIAQAQAMHNAGRFTGDSRGIRLDEKPSNRDGGRQIVDTQGRVTTPVLNETLHKRLTGRSLPDWASESPTSAADHMRHAAYHISIAGQHLDNLRYSLAKKEDVYPASGGEWDGNEAGDEAKATATEYASGGFNRGAPDFLRGDVERAGRVAANQQKFIPANPGSITERLYPGSSARGSDRHLYDALARQHETEHLVMVNGKPTFVTSSERDALRGAKPAPRGSVVGTRPNDAQLEMQSQIEKQRRAAALATPEGQEWLARDRARVEEQAKSNFDFASSPGPNFDVQNSPQYKSPTQDAIEQQIARLHVRRQERLAATGSAEQQPSAESEASIATARTRAAYRVAADVNAGPGAKKQARDIAGISKPISFLNEAHVAAARAHGISEDTIQRAREMEQDLKDAREKAKPSSKPKTGQWDKKTIGDEPDMSPSTMPGGTSERPIDQPEFDVPKRAARSAAGSALPPTPRVVSDPRKKGGSMQVVDLPPATKRVHAKFEGLVRSGEIQEGQPIPQQHRALAAQVDDTTKRGIFATAQAAKFDPSHPWNEGR